MASATNAIQIHERMPDLKIETQLEVATAVTIYAGTLISIDGSGDAIVATTGSRIAGIAQETVEAGENVSAFSNHIVKIALSGAAKTHLNTTVYAADNQTAQAGAVAAILGRVVGWETGYVWVKLTLRA